MQFADVVVVVVGDQHRIDPRQVNSERGKLPHHATAGIDQDGIVAGLDQQRGGAAGNVGTRRAGAEQNDGRFQGMTTQPLSHGAPPRYL